MFRNYRLQWFTNIKTLIVLLGLGITLATKSRPPGRALSLAGAFIDRPLAWCPLDWSLYMHKPCRQRARQKGTRESWTEVCRRLVELCLHHSVRWHGMWFCKTAGLSHCSFSAVQSCRHFSLVVALNDTLLWTLSNPWNEMNTFFNHNKNRLQHSWWGRWRFHFCD